MASIVSFSAARVIELIEEEEPALAQNEVRVRTLFSGISAGTELSTYRGTNPHLTKRWDADLRLFVEGSADEPFPVTNAGYEEVGEVVECGSAVRGVAVGDRIWGTWGHRSTAVLDAEFAGARLLPATADPRVGMFSHIGAVALNAVIDADIHVGETVAVFGLGVPGQLVAQLARLNGGRVIVIDGIASRRDLALELGAEVAIDPASNAVAERIRELTGGRGADAAIEITGNYRALQEAARSVAYNSRVCVAGFYQGEASELRLGEEFHHNRVQLVSSQISGQAASVQHRWNRYRLNCTIVELATAGRLAVLPLISSELPYRDAAAAFRLLDENPHDVLQLVLDFTDAA